MCPEYDQTDRNFNSCFLFSRGSTKKCKFYFGFSRMNPPRNMHIWHLSNSYLEGTRFLSCSRNVPDIPSQTKSMSAKVLGYLSRTWTTIFAFPSVLDILFLSKARISFGKTLVVFRVRAFPRVNFHVIRFA